MCVKSVLNPKRAATGMSAEKLIEGTTAGEDGQERRARELAELLQELRVVLPGVQVLFAFLLTVPFAPGFEGVTPLQKDVFFGTLVCTTLSTGLLMAPSAHHRILWRRHAREHRLKVANRLVVAGIALLLPAIAGSLFVITDVIFGSRPAAVVTAVIAVFLVYVWFVMPLTRRLDGDG
jgi:hypothetical protein